MFQLSAGSKSPPKAEDLAEESAILEHRISTFRVFCNFELERNLKSKAHVLKVLEGYVPKP